MSKSKAKGTIAESALVKYLLLQGFPGAERRALTGNNDQGDITGIPGLVMEVKNQRTYHIPAWLDETEIETANAKADYGLLIIKPNGVGLGNVADWWAVLPVCDAISLLREAGYGDSK